MRLLCFSDLHCNQDAARSLVKQADGVDVVIGAGDFANQHRGLELTLDILSEITTPTVLVPGNGETVDALRAAVADVLPTDEPDFFYDDLFLMRFVMTHSKGGKECNLQVPVDSVSGLMLGRAHSHPQ